MFAKSGRAELAYEITGFSDGADVLLIHAGVTDRRSWQHVVKRLAPRHRCIAYDMRGYGETQYEHEDGWSPGGRRPSQSWMQPESGRPSSSHPQWAARLPSILPSDTLTRVAGLVLIGPAIRGAPYPELVDGPTAELNSKIEAAEAAGDVAEVNRLEARMWLDGPTADEGRVVGPARDLFLEMNGRALRAENPGKQAEIPAAWPRLGEITVPTLIMIGRLDAEDIWRSTSPPPR
jgi:pimeloyl-ACP methyl ester carboxylesterase